MSKVLVDYPTIYRKIMALDPLIRFLTIIDSNGRLMYGGQREEIRNYLSPENQRLSLRHALDAWELRNRFSDQIGKGRYALAEYEKIKRITIPIDSKHLVYLTTESHADHGRLIDGITSLIQELDLN